MINIETLLYYFKLNQGSVLMSLGDKGCHNLLREEDKKSKIKMVDFSIQKYFDLPEDFFANIIFIVFLK